MWRRVAVGSGIVAAGYAGGVAAGVLPRFGGGAKKEDKSSSVTDRVFLKVRVGGDIQEPIVLALYGVECPRTVANFKALAASTSPMIGYRGCRCHRIIPGFMVQSGDFTRGDGAGGTSIYGGKFDDESFEHRHTAAGVLSMANSGPNTNTSQFFITFKSTPWLDGKHVVFGHVVDGLDVLRKIEAAGTRSGRPKAEVLIVDCGCLERSQLEAENYVRAQERRKSSG